VRKERGRKKRRNEKPQAAKPRREPFPRTKMKRRERSRRWTEPSVEGEETGLNYPFFDAPDEEGPTLSASSEVEKLKS